MFRVLRKRRTTLTSRTAGYFNDRLDGAGDMLHRARGASILDIGCNRGMVAFQFAMAGASLVHGCDVYEEGLKTAREVFAEWPISSRFEYVDLIGGPSAVSKAFGSEYRRHYDIVLYLAVHHKLKRVMEPAPLDALVRHLVERAGKWFLWRGILEQFDEVAAATDASGLVLVQTSNISREVRNHIAIWTRPGLLDQAEPNLLPRV
jgi:ribosomal protein L11 methylase PrmA